MLQRSWNLDAAIGFNACTSEPESELCSKQTFPLLNIVMVMSETGLQLQLQISRKAIPESRVDPPGVISPPGVPSIEGNISI